MTSFNGVDCERNLTAIYFTHDPRKSKMPPSPYRLNVSKPQDAAEMIFMMGIDQCSSLF
jgi:hypothetical protein